MIKYSKQRLEQHMEKVIAVTDLIGGETYTIIGLVDRLDENGRPDDLLRLVVDGVVVRLSVKEYLEIDVPMYVKVKLHGDDVEFPATFMVIDTYDDFITIESRYN